MAINHGMGYSHNMCQENIFMARHKEPVLFTNIPSNEGAKNKKLTLPQEYSKSLKLLP
jgi:hypothetical protein